MILGLKFFNTIIFTSISIRLTSNAPRSSNHHVKLFFMRSVFPVSHDDKNSELSVEEVDGQGLTSQEESLSIRESKHFSSIPEDFATRSKSWHCFRATRSSDHVQNFMPSSNFSVCSIRFWVPEKDLLISMKCAAQCRLQTLMGFMWILPFL